MRQKPCKISFRLNEHQKEVLDEEAQRQGITVSKLMLRMSGSYLEAQRKGEPLTAVTYGEWLLGVTGSHTQCQFANSGMSK